MSSSPRPVSIVVLTWNGLELTQRCLESLRRNPSSLETAVIVVDNGSSDGTIAVLESLPWVRLIRNGENLGYSRGCNLGILAADPESDVLLLNNDTVVNQEDWLDRIQRLALSAPDVGIVGCRLTLPDGRLQHAGSVMPTTYRGSLLGGGERDIGQCTANREVESVVFACAYLRRELIRAIGGLDEDYFAYYEDSDYCRRAARAGFRTLCCGEVTIEHRQHGSSAANEGGFSDHHLDSRETFRRKWSAEIDASWRWSLGWRSWSSLPGGYPHASRNLMLALERQRVRITYESVFDSIALRRGPEPAETESELLAAIRARTAEVPRAEVTFGQADMFEGTSAAVRIGYSMLEVDGLPDEWVRQANRMDEVWVPTRFNLETFRSSGVERPIHVVPLGIDPDYFHPEIRSFHPGQSFLFLSVFEWGERKAPELLLRAFNEEFRRGEDAVLLCRIVNADPSIDVAASIRSLDLSSAGGRIVISLNDLLPFHQLPALYRSADCFVLPSRGEGWGMPALEAMACGLPVIATDWSGTREFLNEETGYPLRIDGLTPAVARCPYYRGFRWAEPSYEHLRHLMRHVFEHPEAARAKGREAARQAHARWTWDASARAIIARLDALGGSRAAPPDAPPTASPTWPRSVPDSG